MMIIVRSILRLITFALYVVFTVMVLYFPAAELFGRLAGERPPLQFWLQPSVEDALLPGLFLASAYAAVMAIRRKLDHAEAHGEDANSSGSN